MAKRRIDRQLQHSHDIAMKRKREKEKQDERKLFIGTGIIGFLYVVFVIGCYIKLG